MSKNIRVNALAFVTALALGGCASMGWASSDKKLIKQASFDHDCPAEKISVIKSMEGGMGQASFVLDVCGTERRYERMGTAYFEKGNEPDSVKKVKGA